MESAWAVGYAASRISGSAGRARVMDRRILNTPREEVVPCPPLPASPKQQMSYRACERRQLCRPLVPARVPSGAAPASLASCWPGSAGSGVTAPPRPSWRRAPGTVPRAGRRGLVASGARAPSLAVAAARPLRGSDAGMRSPVSCRLPASVSGKGGLPDRSSGRRGQKTAAGQGRRGGSSEQTRSCETLGDMHENLRNYGTYRELI
jgi:hypothetical protein